MRGSSFIAAAVLVGAAAGAVALVPWDFARARPPAGADLASPEAKWFQTLKQPQTGASCCDISDCRKVATREASDHWEFYADVKEFGGSGDNQWHVIPEDKWLRKKTNPTGETVVCWDPRFGVMCAIKPVGG
jgi:hypothetical protein